jgi:FtsH-binding integral membrane protein
MELSKWEKKFVTKHIRKKRKLSFKTRMIIWGVVSNVCALIMLVFYWIEKTEYLFLVVSVFIISFSLCSTNSLCNIIKKYDDKFNWEI